MTETGPRPNPFRREGPLMAKVQEHLSHKALATYAEANAATGKRAERLWKSARRIGETLKRLHDMAELVRQAAAS